MNSRYQPGGATFPSGGDCAVTLVAPPPVISQPMKRCDHIEAVRDGSWADLMLCRQWSCRTSGTVVGRDFGIKSPANVSNVSELARSVWA
jgi:hypothetical protein